MFFFLVKFVQTHKVTQRLEAKVIEIHLYDTSFYNLKPRSWLGVEVVCGAATSTPVHALVSQFLKEDRAHGGLQKSGIMQSDLLLLPFNAPKHWVLVITLMETKEVLIIDPLETYLQHKDISAVETTQEALTTCRRKIAILLMEEAESVEEYCVYSNLVTCKKESEDCMMGSSVTLVRGGHMCPACQRKSMKKM
ncbi:unnamed protein product [Lepidochelys olivacea]